MAKNSGDKKGALYFVFKSPWTHWVGLRHLKKKNSAFLNLITALSTFGVGLGVTAMIVVLSVMDGFETELKKRLMRSDLHILVQPKPGAENFDHGRVQRDGDLDQKIAAFAAANSNVVTAAWPIIQTEAILRTDQKVAGVEFKGLTDQRLKVLDKQMVYPEKGVTAEEISEFSDEGDAAPETAAVQPKKGRGIFIGQELAYVMGLAPGDEITLISPTETQGPMGSVPRSKKFQIEGVYASGIPEQELHTVFAREKSVYSFLRKRNVLTQWEISLTNFDQAAPVAKRLQAVSDQMRVRDWQQLNANLFASLKLERLAMFIVLAFIVLVASFNIVTTLTLMVYEKKKEIAILRAMGARASEIGAIFLSEGLWIAAVGVTKGVVLAFGICFALKRYDIIELPDIYYDRTLPVTFDPWVYLVVAVVAVVIILVACTYPSRKAAQLSPLEGIRAG